MIIWKKVLFSMLAGVMLASCTGNPTFRSCEFVYTDQMRDSLVLPLIKKVIGEEAYKFYDYERPTVLYKSKEVWLLMGPIQSIGDYTLMSEDNFVVVLEQCTNKYIEYFTQRMNQSSP